ncbi:MAG: hypothetical protein KDD94_02610 [Calditrichaeota bacterium]|nr:hypothetical protein [Calditrichota bacterium]
MITRFVCCLLIFISCSSPYYNTLYNAEKLYKSGERLAPRALINRKDIHYRSSVSSASKSVSKNADLEKVLEKCARVLIDYGDTQEENSYADEAYYLMVKSSFYLERYDECVQIAKRMEDKSPNSHYLNEVHVYKADALAHLGDFTAAIQTFQQVDENSDLDIYAESVMGVAKVAETQEKNDQAISVLLAFYNRLHESERLGDISEEMRFDLLDYLTDLLIENRSTDEIINITTNFSDFDNIEFKKRLAVKRITAINQVGNQDLIDQFVETVYDDPDLSPEADFIDFIDLLRSRNEMPDSVLNKAVITFEKENRTSQFLSDVYYMYIDRLKKSDAEADSIVKAYAKLLLYEKNQEKKDDLTQQSNQFKEYAKFYNDRKAISQLRLRLDSMNYAYDNGIDFDSLAVDSNRIAKLASEIGTKDLTNKWDFANYYYDDKEIIKARQLFADIIEMESDTVRLPLAYLYLAQIEERLENQEIADSLYRLVYANFDQYKENDDLMAKLGIEKKVKLSKSELLYRNTMNQIDLDKTAYPVFESKYQQIVDSLAENSKALEKLKFNRIYILLRDNSQPDSTIQYIKSFKKDYPKSELNAYLNKYSLTPVEEKEEVKEEKRDEAKQVEEDRSSELPRQQVSSAVSSKFQNDSSIRLLSEVKDIYPYSQNLEIDVELELNTAGEVSKVNLLNESALDVQAKIESICKVFKFNAADVGKRSFKLTIKLGDLR